MKLRIANVIVFFLATSVGAFAATQPPSEPPPTPSPVMPREVPTPALPPQPPPGAGQTVKPAPTPPAATVEVRRTRGRDLNLQVEITITDQSGTEAPQKKVVSMVVADSTMGRIRASADAQRPNIGYVGTGLNIDARPSVLENDRILLELTVEYTPFRDSGQVTQRPTILNESLSVILQNGKPMVVSQAADPVTDRKMTVEVRASIQK